MATIKDVAGLAKVSISTVSLAFNQPERVTEETRERIFSAANRLHYTPVSKPAPLGRTGKTILVLSNLTLGMFICEVLRGMNDAFLNNEYNMVLVNHEQPDPQAWPTIINRDPAGQEGLVIMGAPHERVKEHINKHRIPAITCFSDYRNPAVGSIDIDNFDSGVNIGNHIINNGYRRVAIMGDVGSDCLTRRDGVLHALDHAGIKVPAQWMLSTALFDCETGFRQMRELLDQGGELPEATICMNDELAIGAISALASRGKRVPHDMAITGFDDIPMAKIFRPQITTVAIPKYELGIQAALMLIRMLNGGSPEHITMHSKLCVRASCGFMPAMDKNRSERGLTK